MIKTIKVSGMHCNSCDVLLSDVVSEIKGVAKVSADHSKGMLVVEMDKDLTSEIKNVVEKEGYKVV